MQYGYTHRKGQGRGPGTSRNPRVMVKLDEVSVDTIKIVKGNFMSVQFVHFLLQALLLIFD